MNENKLPWCTRPDADGLWSVYNSIGERIITSTKYVHVISEENAKFIVKSVNMNLKSTF